MIVTPSILTGSIEVAQTQLDQLAQLPGCDRVQIDVVDGWFADELTLTPSDLPQLEFYHLTPDLHLMTQEPLDFIYEAQAVLNKDSLGLILGQVEKMSHQPDFIEWAKRCGWLAGLSLDLHTPLDAIDPEVWPMIDAVQIMGVPAGQQGQKFNALVLDLVKQTIDHVRSGGFNCQVIVDGGVSLAVAGDLADLGVDQVVIGSGLWQSPDLAQAWQAYQSLETQPSKSE